MNLCCLLALPLNNGSFSVEFWLKVEKIQLFQSHCLDSDVVTSDGWCLDVSTFSWCILVSVMDPHCLEALNQPRRAGWTALAGGQSAQVGRVTADLLAVLCDSGQRMWTLDLPLPTVGWFLFCPTSWHALTRPSSDGTTARWHGGGGGGAPRTPAQTVLSA